MTRLARWPIAALALLLTACAAPGTAGGPAPSPSESDVLPAGDGGIPAPDGAATGSPAEGPEVTGQGTVLQVGDAPPQLCLGGVAESYPPQCGGPDIAGWDWNRVEQWEQASGVTWGAYAVTGTWDGTVFTSTAEPVPLSLYDALPFEDPLEGRQGRTDASELERIQREIFEAENADMPLSGGVERGFVSLLVFYDDGSIQARMDTTYGPDVVVVRSALRPAA